MTLSFLLGSMFLFVVTVATCEAIQYEIRKRRENRRRGPRLPVDFLDRFRNGQE